ncbi:MAG: hypothetical protein ACLPLP_02285 [Mycobacterium sp.]
MNTALSDMSAGNDIEYLGLPAEFDDEAAASTGGHSAASET